MSAKWYVIQTKPQSEDAVKQHLEQARFEVFYPRIRAAVRGPAKPSTRIKSLFPSYLFAKLDVGDGNILHMIKYTRGVRKILGGGENPVAIPEEVVTTIRERVDEDGVVEQQLVFRKGDRVRIKSGWMQDLIGILEKPVSSEGRVRVLLDIVGKCVRAELSSAEIERPD
jgi:transcription elongation factor/antiterminator RfaH